jgi:hypothetical protein
MEYSHSEELGAHIQPVLVYEGSVLSSAGYRDMGEPSSSELHRIIGFEMIDAHLVQLLEEWRTSGASGAGIDAYTIIESFPDRYQLPTDNLADTLALRVIEEVRSDDNPAEIIIHTMQVPKVYEILGRQVSAQLMSDAPLDRTLQDPLVEAYLQAYAQMELPEGKGGKMEALRHIYLTCKSDSSTL